MASGTNTIRDSELVFTELTADQRKYVIAMVELQLTEKYESTMWYMAHSGGRSIVGLPREKGVGQVSICEGMTINDLSALENEGYLTVVRGSSVPLVSLRQQAVREYEIYKNPDSIVLTTSPRVTGDRVFIGHGHAKIWLELRDFLESRLGIRTDEFNREAVAGYTTKERLSQMLDSACFAFLVMTGEDTTNEGVIQARLNVVHEAGLFQGRLGFNRAIILKEDGCDVPSNLHGLTVIMFPKDNVRAAFEDVRDVLQREGLIN